MAVRTEWLSLCGALVATLSQLGCGDDGRRETADPGVPVHVVPGPEAAGQAFPLVPDAAGFVSEASNELGLQGAWTARAGIDSRMDVRVDGGDVCFTGQAAMIPAGAATSDYFGAIASLDLCRAGSEPTASYPLGACPWSPGLAAGLAGFGFSVDGTLPAVLRAAFPEAGRQDVPYVLVREAGEVAALFSDALVRNDPTAAFSHPVAITALELRVPASRAAARPFDFCVRGLAALAGRGWTSKEIPDWVYQAGPGQRVELAGVNLAGAEFGQQNLPGTYGNDYVYPSAADVDMFAARGMNTVRLPFRWERLQRTLGGDLDTQELQRLAAAVYGVTARGMTLILDPHNFARYTSGGVEGVVGTAAVPVAAFADLWRRLAEVFGSDPSVVFGLVNEPHDMRTEVWLDAANAAIAAIRTAGARNLVLVPGNAWTGAHNWTASYYGTPNSVAMGAVVDPANHFAYEMHQYLDADSSGTGSSCVSETIGVERMAAATNWLRLGGRRALLGELNGVGTRTCLRAIDNLLAYVEANSDVWMGWAVWAGGPRWGDNALSVQLLPNGKERPQLTVLRRHLGDGVVAR